MSAKRRTGRWVSSPALAGKTNDNKVAASHTDFITVEYEVIPGAIKMGEGKRGKRAIVAV